jgi:hypothetical protein
MSHPCIAVLTARGTQRLLDEGGTMSWRLNPENARRMRYCVCIQNREDTGWGAADHEHHVAFLVGRISAVVPSPDMPERYLIKFGEYAVIHQKDAWGGFRNPIRYTNLEEFGVDPDKLQWNPMPQQSASTSASPENSSAPENTMPLTMAQARAGLALGLGVPEKAIEITVRY